MVGESIAGGTTTALAVLLAQGYRRGEQGQQHAAREPSPHQGAGGQARAYQTKFSAAEMKDDAMLAVAAVGDPMMPAAAGIIVGAARKVPVIMAGGTQMAAVLAVVRSVEPKAMENVALGTTQLDPKRQELRPAPPVEQIGPVPVLARTSTSPGRASTGFVL